jgi:hypothetical protein
LDFIIRAALFIRSSSVHAAAKSKDSKTRLRRAHFVSQGQLEISQTRSVWFITQNHFRPERIPEIAITFSAVPSGWILFRTTNPAQCAGLISNRRSATERVAFDSLPTDLYRSANVVAGK